MTGHVHENNAFLTVPVLAPGQPPLSLEFVIDTGFTGFLTLPEAAAVALGLDFLRRMPANLADDSTINLSVYALTIVWNGDVREVEVLATGRRPLLGTLLLRETCLSANWTSGGLVEVVPLSQEDAGIG